MTKYKGVSGELSRLMEPIVEIIVTDYDVPATEVPRIYVGLEFGLMLRIRDVIIFDDTINIQPEWVKSWENVETLSEGAITLTERVIANRQITFYAERS